MTSIPVCKSVDLMPKYPCAQHDKRKDLKKPKGPVNAKEMVRFLNKERKYSAVSGHNLWTTSAHESVYFQHISVRTS